MSDQKHSPVYAKASQEYAAGRWKKSMIRILVERALLSSDEYAEITGEPYVVA